MQGNNCWVPLPHVEIKKETLHNVKVKPVLDPCSFYYLDNNPLNVVFVHLL